MYFNVDPEKLAGNSESRIISYSMVNKSQVSKALFS